MKAKVKKSLKQKENRLKSFPINAKIKPYEKELVKRYHKSTK